MSAARCYCYRNDGLPCRVCLKRATATLAMASEYTGQVYKRGQYGQAAADLRVWIKTMKTRAAD